MAAASTNQWAAVGDAVNSAALVETGFNIVRASLPYLSVALGATKMYSRGAGGYCDRLNELETIIQSWDQILGNLSPAEIAQIDAEIGPNTVRDLCQRLSAIKVSFGKLKVTHVQASFWDKVALWETPLSYEYDNIRAVVTSTDAHFKATTDNTTRDLFHSMAAEAHQAQQQSMPGAFTTTTSYRPPPRAHVHAGAGGPSMLPPPALMSYRTSPPRQPMAADAASNMFDQLVQFTVAYITPFARRRGRIQRGNQAPLPRGYNRV